MMPPAQNHLIDVRTPSEFATGSLSNDIHPFAINIEYQSIAALPSIISGATKDDNITLYCRSGRRSDIARQTLRELGYVNVRDIGGFEEARAVLKREEVERKVGIEIDEKHGAKEVERARALGRKKAFGALLKGLQGCE